MLHFDLPKTPNVSISARFLKLFCTPWNPSFCSLTNPPDWANMLNFHTFTKYTYFKWKPTILFNFDLPKDPSESQTINIRQVLKAFLHILPSPAQLSPAQLSPAQLSPAQPSSAQLSPAQLSPLRCKRCFSARWIDIVSHNNWLIFQDWGASQPPASVCRSMQDLVRDVETATGKGCLSGPCSSYS